MIRVEVQNADVSIRDEKIVANVHGNSGTNLILLSDDDSGYMPYRIENFSKEVSNWLLYQSQQMYRNLLFSFFTWYYCMLDITYVQWSVKFVCQL